MNTENITSLKKNSYQTTYSNSPIIKNKQNKIVFVTCCEEILNVTFKIKPQTVLETGAEIYACKLLTFGDISEVSFDRK